MIRRGIRNVAFSQIIIRKCSSNQNKACPWNGGQTQRMHSPRISASRGVPQTSAMTVAEIQSGGSSATLDTDLGNEANDESALPELGRSLREREYSFPDDVHAMNGGSYGCVPQRVLKEQYRLMCEREYHPEYWYRYRSMEMYREGAAAVARVVGSRPENLVLVENSTTASTCNSIVKSLKFEPGDQILVSNHTFYGINELMRFVTTHNSDIGLVTINIPLESTTQEIIDIHTEALDNNPRIKLAMIDHITCATSIVLPIKDLIEHCHRRGVLVAIDGAHAPGQLPLELEKLGADFYCGNMHKWFFSPRGCALLYIHPQHHSWLRPAVSSIFAFADDLQERFHETGTRDNSPFYAATYSIGFQKYLGGLERIATYNSGLAYWAADMFAKAWRTRRIQREATLMAPYMCLVLIPETPMVSQYRRKLDGAAQLCRDIADHGFTVMVSDDGERMLLRVAANVYNYKDEYLMLLEIINKLLDISDKTLSLTSEQCGSASQ